MDYPFGLDISEYQGAVNWPSIIEHVPTVHFVYIRAGQFDDYQDTKFRSNWSGAKDASRFKIDLGNDPIMKGAYWVPTPVISGHIQARACLSVLESDKGELPVAIDLELKYNVTPKRMQDMIEEFNLEIQEATGKPIIIYSTIAWIHQYLSPYMKPWEGLKRYRFWIAQWLNSGQEAPGRIDKLAGLPEDNILFHQTACSINTFGVQSKKLDYDRFLGTLDDLHELADVSTAQPQQPTNEEILKKLWAWYLEEHNAKNTP